MFNPPRILAGLLLVAAVLLFAAPAHAAQELQQANRIDCSSIGTNNWVCFSNAPSLVFSVECDNFSGADVYLMVFDSGTNSTAGTRPAASAVKIPTGSTGGKFWGPSGAPFDSLCVAVSTTPFNLTNASAGLGIMSVTRRASR